MKGDKKGQKFFYFFMHFIKIYWYKNFKTKVYIAMKKC